MTRQQPHLELEWSTLEAQYTDEFGPVTPDVYAAAGRIWRRSQDYARRVLRDADDAYTLLLKAAAQTTRARDEKSHPINSLDAYLFQTFKRVVLDELEKDNNRRRFEAEARLDTEWETQARSVERRILLGELVGAMDEWTRSVFEWLTLDYSFEEIARHLGMNVRVLRNKYNRHLKALMKQIRAEAAAPESRAKK